MGTLGGGRTRGWVVGRVAGAPVVVSPGWLLAAVVLTLLVAPTVELLVPVRGGAALAVAGAFALMLLGSVFLHELAHALVARRFGITVHELAVTLLGGHTRLGGAAPDPRSSALVAAAGPAVNLALGAAAWLLGRTVPAGGVLWLLLSAAAAANVFVGLFNLVPGLPLDGGRVLEAAVWRSTGDRARGTLAAGWAGRVAAVGVLAYAVLRPVLEGRSVSLTGVVWGALVGGFLWTGADAAVRSARAERRVAGVQVSALMRPATGLPARAVLADLDSALTHGRGGDVVLVDGEGRPVAVVDPAAALSVPEQRRATTPVSAVAVPLVDGAVVDAGLSGAQAVAAVAALTRRTAVVAVLEAGRVVGVLHSGDVVRALRGS